MWSVVLSIVVDFNKSLYWVLPLVIILCAILRKVHITTTITAIMITVFYHILAWTAITITWHYVLFELLTLIIIITSLVRIYRATDYPEAHQPVRHHTNDDFIKSHRSHK